MKEERKYWTCTNGVEACDDYLIYPEDGCCPEICKEVTIDSLSPEAAESV